MNECIISVVELNRPISVTVTTRYPFVADTNLILILEEQPEIQEKNKKNTEITGTEIS